ncbi:YqaJ viral recombinase family protein [Diaphorobacter sp. HDW4A]|uniref:YqaJ viral recombinase family nuclease n=1 Tax=Diaphorobacter sp. HDW4A TaxID=2714924 RepID=UPI00140DDD45|nr:YqaJ viral recombinase family protein [Diaphorobacter sp. HDW4A]QIL80835.1 YqaJ viral recombinase family protein [Diaphorobacter sp. HDW4A]
MPTTASTHIPTSQARRPALRLVSTRDMPRETWLDVRRQGIGSSDAAAAVGLNPYQSPLELWMHKTGKADLLPVIDPHDETSPMYWGTLLEPIVAAHYTKRTGNRVRRVNAVLGHPQIPWMLANIDREVVGASDVQILECKTAGINGAKLWKEGVPEYIQLQVMHQLAVTGKQAADVAVLICGQELQIHRIERDETMITQLIALEAQFWEMVQTGQAPAADASDSSALALRSLYPQDSGDTVDLSEDEPSCGAFAQLVHVRKLLQDWEAQEALLKHQIQQRMGSASHATFTHGAVSWKRSKDGKAFNAALFEKEHPALAKTYTIAKPGSRRFLLQETC